jgi:hypothetical protein
MITVEDLIQILQSFPPKSEVQTDFGHFVTGAEVDYDVVVINTKP